MAEEIKKFNSEEEKNLSILKRTAELCELNNIPVYYNEEEQYICLTDEQDRGVFVRAPRNELENAMGQILIDNEKDNNEYRYYFPELDTFNSWDEKKQDKYIIENVFQPLLAENTLLEYGKDHSGEFVKSGYLVEIDYGFAKTKDEAGKEKLETLEKENFELLRKHRDGGDKFAEQIISNDVSYKDKDFSENKQSKNQELSAIGKEFVHNNLETISQLAKWAGGKAKEASEKLDKVIETSKQNVSDKFAILKKGFETFNKEAKDQMSKFNDWTKEFKQELADKREFTSIKAQISSHSKQKDKLLDKVAEIEKFVYEQRDLRNKNTVDLEKLRKNYNEQCAEKNAKDFADRYGLTEKGLAEFREKGLFGPNKKQQETIDKKMSEFEKKNKEAQKEFEKAVGFAAKEWNKLADKEGVRHINTKYLLSNKVKDYNLPEIFKENSKSYKDLTNKIDKLTERYNELFDKRKEQDRDERRA